MTWLHCSTVIEIFYRTKKCKFTFREAISFIFYLCILATILEKSHNPRMLKEFNFEEIVKIPSKYRSWKWEGKRANLRKKSDGGKGFHIVATHPDSEAGSDYMTSGMTLKKIGILLCSI